MVLFYDQHMAVSCFDSSQKPYGMDQAEGPLFSSQISARLDRKLHRYIIERLFRSDSCHGHMPAAAVQILRLTVLSVHRESHRRQ